MTNQKEIYKCEICGNIVEVLHSGNGTLVCCGQPMNLQEEKIQDPELGEKHVPVINGGKVKISSIQHPMTPEHYIEWIEAEFEDKTLCKKFLNPEKDNPEAEFDCNKKIVKAREYCNLHGLWKKKNE